MRTVQQQVVATLVVADGEYELLRKRPAKYAILLLSSHTQQEKF